MTINPKIKQILSELLDIPKLDHVPNPADDIIVTEGFVISRRSLKHILDNHRKDMDVILNHIEDALTEPIKVADNSHKRPDSLLLSHVVGARFIVAVIEKTKTPGLYRVVSAFLMNHRTHKKLIDISGRAEDSSI